MSPQVAPLPSGPDPRSVRLGALGLGLLAACAAAPPDSTKFAGGGLGAAGGDFGFSLDVGYYQSPEAARLADRMGWYGVFATDFVAALDGEYTGYVPPGGFPGDVLVDEKQRDTWIASGVTYRLADALGLRLGFTLGYVTDVRFYRDTSAVGTFGGDGEYAVAGDSDFVLGADLGVDLLPGPESGRRWILGAGYATAHEGLLLHLAYRL